DHRPSGVPIEFAVAATEADDGDRPEADASVSVPSGIFLVPDLATTDTNGVAGTRVMVGTTPGVFQVRARAPGSNLVFFDIEVSAALSPTVSVWVVYDGLREISSRSAAVLPGLTCEQALSASKNGYQVRTVEGAEEALTFSLAPEVTYAVVAWGRDSTNAEQ